jgi:hypothetical protein
MNPDGPHRKKNKWPTRRTGGGGDDDDNDDNDDDDVSGCVARPALPSSL